MPSPRCLGRWPWRRRVVLSILAMAMLLMTVAVHSADASTGRTVTSGDGAYTVQPGDTLASIALSCGVNPFELAHQNAIQHPRQLYPGQVLRVHDGAGCPGVVHTVAAGENLLLLSRAAGVAPEIAALRNGRLMPAGLRAGQQIWLPSPVSGVSAVWSGGVAAVAAPRISAAVRSGARLWDVLALNPAPLIAGNPVLTLTAASTPGGTVSPSEPLPFPLTALRISSQPVARGETVAVTLRASEPISCSVRFLDVSEACYALDQAGYNWYGLIGLPPLMNTGLHTVTVEVSGADDLRVSASLPIVVSAGRYDYERLDLPSDRQALLDPARSQFERERIAALQMLRTPERRWDYPLRLPTEASITSYYGSRRSYGAGFGSYHSGTDFQGEVGMPVVAPAPGTVVLADPLVVRGNAVLIDHGGGLITGYWHLSRIDVVVGQQVVTGERIGALGNTGLSTGPHLHWELWVNGASVNALAWIDPHGAPALLEASQ